MKTADGETAASSPIGAASELELETPHELDEAKVRRVLALPPSPESESPERKEPRSLVRRFPSMRVGRASLIRGVKSVMLVGKVSSGFHVDVASCADKERRS